MVKLLVKTLIFLAIFTSVQAKPGNSCEGVFSEEKKSKVSFEIQKWSRLAPAREVAAKFGYSPSVVERILKHEPQIYVEMAKVFLGQKSKYKEKDMMAVDLYRGMVLHPKDYDPAFEDNFSGGNTKPGKSWFSADSSTAHSYATPTREYVLENKPENQKTLPVGIRIHVQLPGFILKEAKIDSFRREINVALDRSELPNESLYISSVLVIIADYEIKDFKEKDFSYEEFLQKYLGRSKYKNSFFI